MTTPKRPLTILPEAGGDDMHRYPHHVGDYATATAHLTMMQHGAYRLLLDHYYSTEKPLPLDRAKLYRIARASTIHERTAVDDVLTDFFTETADGWHNNRADSEIADYQAACEKNRANGARGGRPKLVAANPTETQPKPSGFPVGSGSVSETKPYQSPSPIPQEKHDEDDGGEAPALALDGGELPTAVCTLIAARGELFAVTDRELTLWREAYPAVNVLAELPRMAAWFDANPKKRPTLAGMKRFVTGWLSRNQDRAAEAGARMPGFAGKVITGGFPSKAEAREARNAEVLSHWAGGGQ